MTKTAVFDEEGYVRTVSDGATDHAGRGRNGNGGRGWQQGYGGEGCGGCGHGAGASCGGMDLSDEDIPSFETNGGVAASKVATGVCRGNS